MKTFTRERSKYWLLWPDFIDEKDARDGANLGVWACGIIAIVNGLTFVYRYYEGGDINQALTGILIATIDCVLGYGIFKMSRVASSTALGLFSADKLYSFAVYNSPLGGVGFMLVWYLVQANRAIYWFKRVKTNEEGQK